MKEEVTTTSDPSTLHLAPEDSGLQREGSRSCVASRQGLLGRLERDDAQVPDFRGDGRMDSGRAAHSLSRFHVGIP